jgi:hypothetical protein
MRTNKHGVHKDCQCDCDMICRGLGCEQHQGMCNSHREVYNRLSNLWTSILCEKPELSMWQKRHCLMGTCADYGLELLKLCQLELGSDKLVKWKRIRYKVFGTTEDGVPRKAVTLEYQESPACELVEYLKPKLTAFVLHNYVAS